MGAPRSQEDIDASYDRDRERFYAQDPTQDQAQQHTRPQRRLQPGANKGTTVNEVYAQCADQVVALSRCVEQEGPMWYFRCGEPFIAMQRCYDERKSWGKFSLSDWWSQWQRNAQETLAVRREQWQWWWDDLTNGRGRT